MNDFLKAKLLLNACKAPLSAWEKLRASDAPEALWAHDKDMWLKLGLRPSSCIRLTELLGERDWAERELDRAESFGARFVTADDVGYPARLKDLNAPPIGIYVKGELDILKPCLAVVGTRRCSRYGTSVAEAIGRSAVRAGYRVVSGGAKGIDAAGHRGCMSERGATTAVLGTAVDRVYPAEHHQLFLEIQEKGALVSEYPMGTGGDPWRFPERNRIIVGLSKYVVVVESPEDGGAMITARLGLETGREIWCVPGRITDAASRGTNSLIRDGAHPLVDIDDFIGKISGRYGQLLLEFGDDFSLPAQRLTDNLSEKDKLILGLLQRKGNRMLDDIMEESGFDFVEAQLCLVTLCAVGLVYESGPGRYSAGL